MPLIFQPLDSGRVGEGGYGLDVLLYFPKMFFFTKFTVKFKNF